ncbi:DUF3196 family protein [Spiroplasma floricola]|uniref:DUF3196 domain-containing protein n=1 Tax=Spiroplasma floricola 23-6 TaxID=1336749 RepID=A0A2K8SD78_9MOLU|nr:DUF3196 family protein [Spiroplasma floricola]AUB31411.1 hypothetical protein SFLOR_v1c03540 [Spiroplasma floricola 23-6]
MKNYYDETLEKIEEAEEQNNLQEAFRIISEELNAPYIPQDFLEKLQKIEIRLIEKANLNKSNSFNWNIDKVLEAMSKKLNQDVQLMAFDALRGLNARLIINDIKEYLQNTEIKPEYKSFLILVLIEQAIDEELIVKKNNQSILINPLKYDLLKAQQVFKDLELKMEQVVYYSNPSLFNICENIANTYFYHVFPIFNLEESNLNDLAMAIIMKASNSLGLEWNEKLELKLNFNKENTMLLLNELNEII